MCFCFNKNHLKEILDLKNALLETEKENDTLVQENAQLKQNQEVIDVTKKPEWLDDTIYPYKPFISIEEGKFTLEDPRTIFNSKNFVIQKIVKDNKWKDFPYENRLKAIWYFVIDWLDYKYDVSEDWQPSFFTYYRKYGDCEDSSLMFVDLCRAAEIPADSIFLCCGWYKDSSGNFGHAFPIVKLNNNQFYIYETTLNFHADAPKLFKNSNYDCSWGLMNDRWYGKSKIGDNF